MSVRRPCLDLVRTDAGWHARFVAKNGKVVWWTETYTRKRAALRAIYMLVHANGIGYVDERVKS